MPLSRDIGPDFICAGMPKAATGWLFDQLKHHPDFWLPPTKEITYLSRSPTRVKSAEKWLVQLERPEKANRLRRWANRRPDDTRDLEFLKDMTSRIGQSMDLAIYKSLFRFKENALSGDLSSGYGALAPDVLSQLQTHLPHTKIILLVRD